jgi:hypothetical protein
MTYNQYKTKAYKYAFGTSGKERLQMLYQYFLETNHPHPKFTLDEHFEDLKHMSSKSVCKSYLESCASLCAVNDTLEEEKDFNHA